MKITKKARRAVAGDGIPRQPLAAIVQRLGKTMSRDDMAVKVQDAASQMSRLMTGNIEEFSADRYAKMLTRLGCDITVNVSLPSPKRGRAKSRGKVRVVVYERR